MSVSNAAEIYKNSEELRAAAERRLRRALSDEDMRAIDPEGLFSQEAPYSERDLDELLQLARDEFAVEKVDPQQRQRIQAMARVRREAEAAKSFVEEQRLRLFGHPCPPFTDARDAADWIDENLDDGETCLVRFEFEIPLTEFGLAQLVAARDLLIDVIAEAQPSVNPDRVYLKKRGSNGRIRLHGSVIWSIPYFKFDDHGSVLPGVFHRTARPDTKLGHLYEELKELANATRWSDTACAHHLLTGGLMSSPVLARTNAPAGSRAFASPYVELTIPDPFSVSEEEVLRKFRAARNDLVDFVDHRRRKGRKRARGVESPELVPFVKRHSHLSWKQIWEEWKAQRHERSFPSHDAMRKAFERARRRSF